ncbi:HlyD family type I secretion periplasmic adaptor subunit [Pelagibacterium sp.]|uniref:HlyD family type I secretion periplasmic adaptor subunit n=1 Tax=Pelagibacterium sp. TaxID=1967288 RepID=UPI003A8E1C92
MTRSSQTPVTARTESLVRDSGLGGFQDLMPGVVLPATPPTRVRQLILWLFFCGFGLFGGLVFWAATAELTGAVVAPGLFSVEGKRLSVQHLEGGIVREIRVSEGETVAKDQVIAVLDGQRTEAALSILRNQLAAQLVQQARLSAELADAEQVSMTPEIQQLFAKDPALSTLFQVQEDVFRNNRNLHKGQLSILGDRIAQLDEQAVGRESRLEGLNRQLSLVQDELTDLDQLFAKGLVPKTRLTQRQMHESSLTGAIGGLEADRDNFTQRISEIRETILQVERDRQRRITFETQEVQERIFDLRQQMSTYVETRRRQTIRAPEAGRIVGLSINTIGQVLEPGQKVLELVPQDAHLVLTTRVASKDIDEVRAGGTAKVQLTAYSFRTTPPVDGEVVLISADALVDAATGRPYYEVLIRIPEAEFARLPNVKTLPGMPGQAMIETSRQTLATYLLDPVLSSMSQALKEGSS